MRKTLNLLWRKLASYPHSFISFTYKKTGIALAMMMIISSIAAKTGVDYENFRGIDIEVQNFMSQWNIPGGSVAITRNGKLIYSRGFGFSDLARTKVAQPGDLYRIASVSKPITSIAVMKLVEQGRLNLDEKVFGNGNILDEGFYDSVITDQRIYDITVRNLLEHTAGWDVSKHFDPPFKPVYVAGVEGMPNPVGDSTLIRYALRTGLDNLPGTHYAYSNIGYLVLGKIIARVSGMSYEDYVRENIFAPLYIRDIKPGRNLLAEKLEREAEYYGEDSTFSMYGDGKKVPWQYGGFNLEAMNAHGGWIASATDLTRLILAVDGFSSVPDILQPATVREMTSPCAVNPYYAKGWCVNERGNWWHTGSLDGTSAFVARMQDGYTWAFLFNSRNDNSPEFWTALDRLPMRALATVDSLPDIDLFAPAMNVSDVAAKILPDGNVNISWKDGDGDGRVVLLSEDTTAIPYPASGVDAGPALSTVVYNGSGGDVMLTGLLPGRIYVLRAYEYFKRPATGQHEIYNLANAGKCTFTVPSPFVVKMP